MIAIDEKQRATADWLVGQVTHAKSDPGAVWSLTGAVGSGKSTVLRIVRDKLEAEHLIPLLVTAPSGEVDSAPIALLEMASQLKSKDMMNGEMTTLADPRRSWNDKVQAVTRKIDTFCEKLVILCDEPTRWYHHDEATLDDTPDHAARLLAEWIAETTHCRRIIAGRMPGSATVRGETKAPRLADGLEFLTDFGEWHGLAPLAQEASDNLAADLTHASVWQMKLLVALVYFKTATEVSRQASPEIAAPVLLNELLDAIQHGSVAGTFRAALVRLALARTSVPHRNFTALTAGISDLERDIIKVCLSEMHDGRMALHPLVRQEIVKRERDSRRWDGNNPWTFVVDDRRIAHRQLAAAYAAENGESLRGQLESFRHELLGDAALPDLSGNPDHRLRFIEQLHEIGRTQSYEFHDHKRAAAIFRLALHFDAKSAYSHHYLAYNLDWLAEESEEVEEHYQIAAELQPTHPWWWSRWISYLATRGQLRLARLKWCEALDALSVSPDDSPRWVFMSLHRWVARWLLHWAELDFAEEVLRSIPTDLSESDASIQAEWDLLNALREAERDAAVFPLTVPARDWWSTRPHTNLPWRLPGGQLLAWAPARVQTVDRPSGKVTFLTGRPAEAGNGPIVLEEHQLTREKVKAGAYKFQLRELTPGSYVELGYYGGRKLLKIGLHRTTVFNDRRLLPLVPPPDRWYGRAVEAGWNSVETPE